MNAIGILPAFKGTAVHDALLANLVYDCRHSLCNAHLLRHLTAADEITDQTRPKAVADLLLAIKATVEQAATAGQAQLAPQALNEFCAQYQHLIEPALQANPAPPPRRGRQGRQLEGPLRNRLLRLKQQASAVLAFMHDFGVPFDNNLTERDLRMAKVRQKIAGGFRSWRGVEIFFIIRGSLPVSTMRKQNQNVLAALNSVFAGTPRMPQLT